MATTLHKKVASLVSRLQANKGLQTRKDALRDFLAWFLKKKPALDAYTIQVLLQGDVGRGYSLGIIQFCGKQKNPETSTYSSANDTFTGYQYKESVKVALELWVSCIHESFGLHAKSFLQEMANIRPGVFMEARLDIHIQREEMREEAGLLIDAILHTTKSKLVDILPHFSAQEAYKKWYRLKMGSEYTEDQEEEANNAGDTEQHTWKMTEEEKTLKEGDLDGVYTVIVADDGSLPAKTDEAKQAILRERKLFEMDSYYQIIKDYTYHTEFVTVTFEEAKALRLFLRGVDLESDESQHNAEKHHFLALRDKMHRAITNLGDDEHKYFIRTSTRSPKDAADKPVFRERLMKLMEEIFLDSEGQLIEEYRDLNLRLIGLRECFSKILCVKSREEMLKLLSYSERCVSDLKRLIDHRHLLDQWDLYLVIRRFRFIPIRNEFRCFVSNGRLTAISQYFPHCLYPKEFRESTEEIKDLIMNFYQNVVRDECGLNEKLHDSYILDLNVDLRTRKVMIIELNPFSKTTGSGFFDWGKDSELLNGRHNGKDVYPEIRIRREMDPHVDAVLNQWNPILSEFENRVSTGADSTCCLLL